jgi:acetylglutamate kinase
VRNLTVLKLGGELLEPDGGLGRLAAAIRALAAAWSLIVVHGGGREIDADAARRGLARRTVDGLRVTDAATLESVVATLAGTVNTRLVAALVAAGLPAVGLTGADAAMVPARPAPPHRAADGRLVDLGLVGIPDVPAPPRLLADLIASGYLPVVACLGWSPDGSILNVNADTLAAHLAAACRADRLIVAGATRGVLDAAGRTIDALDPDTLDALIAAGTASAGMVAKLRACREAVEAGVAAVWIVDGRAADLATAPGTRIGRAPATNAAATRPPQPAPAR